MSALIIGLDVIMAATLPVYFRIIYVLVSKYRKINLDPSFHTLMINSCAINILFALIYIFIQEPASAGLFFDFYQPLAVGLSKVVQIQSTLFNTLKSMFELILGLSRFTAIAFPLTHVKIWTGRRLLVLYSILWASLILAAIPLLLPGSTTFSVNSNVFGTYGIEFVLLGNYYMIYAVGNSGIAAVAEFLNLLCYVGMCLKFRSFLKMRHDMSDAKRLTRGVIRTTIAAFIISIGSWLLVSFFMIVFGNIFATGRSPFTKLEFSVLFRLLTVFNNVLTAWVLIATFTKARSLFFVRRAVVGFDLLPSGTGGSNSQARTVATKTTSPTLKINVRGRF